MVETVINMMKYWEQAIVTEINIAIYVKAGTGEAIHNNRPFHGLVMQDPIGEKVYRFSDGKTVHVQKNDVLYLPKGSYYQVDSMGEGGCFAINFDLLDDLICPPFTISPKNSEGLHNCFKEAERAFHNGDHVCIRKNIYEILFLLKKEEKRAYSPSLRDRLIAPAVEAITQGFTDNGLSVTELAERCGISEAYLRRLFGERYGVSPKEYAIRLRIDYAKRLLQSGQFSVGEVAQICGYAEPCHFSREFSKRVGVSPKEYKKTE